jgi:hypothetical protein
MFTFPIPIWDDLALTARSAALAYAWIVIGICWLVIVAWVIRGAGATRKRKLLTAAVFAGSMVALILTVRESHFHQTADPDLPAQKLPPGNGVQHA